jgi:hypothetical protein
MITYATLVDDDAYLNVEKATNLGEITLTIELVTCEGSTSVIKPDISDSDGKVHERSKKAMVHRVK